MTRYLEDLNSCTDPVSGDYLLIYDASAGSTDKDRKVDVGEFALADRANTFVSTNTFQAELTVNYANAKLSITASSGRGLLQIDSADNDTGSGAIIVVGRNTDGLTPSSGAIEFLDVSGSAWFIHPDDNGKLRIHSSAPTNATDTDGTIVGDQTSMASAKYLYSELSPLPDVLQRVRDGAAAVRQFVYRDGSYARQRFEGVVTDYAPDYGKDRDDDHPAGKALNEIQIIGDLLRTVAWLEERIRRLERGEHGD